MSIVAAAVCVWIQSTSSSPWVDLFDGRSLSGWKQVNGTATYEVKDGAIVGTTSKGSPNSFLATTRDYSDFELEFEVRVHDKLNSGVQIRSRPKTADDVRLAGESIGRYWGPQVEIESSPGQAGYVYGEGTTYGWLSKEPTSADPSKNQHSHFKNGQWNQYRVRSIGAWIRTWINGVPIASVSHIEVFKTHPWGSIGLQVHSIPDNEGPYTVAWRKIRVREIR